MGGAVLGQYLAADWGRVDTELWVSYPPPPGGIVSGANSQQAHVHVRKRSAAGGDVAAQLELWENGVFRAALIPWTTVSSAAGTTLRAWWDNTALLSDPMGSGVELRLRGQGNVNDALEIGAGPYWDYFPVAPVGVGGADADASVGGLSAALVAEVGGAEAEASVGSMSVAPIFLGTNTELRLGYATPTLSPATGAGRQRVAVAVRKAGGGGDPTCRVDLFEAGGTTPVATVIPPTPVSSASGVLLEGDFDAAALSDLSGSGVELRLFGEGAVGGTLEVAAGPFWISDPAIGQGSTIGSAEAVASVGGIASVIYPPISVSGIGGASAEASVGGASVYDTGVRVYEHGGDVWFTEDAFWATSSGGDVAVDPAESRDQAYESGAPGASDVVVILGPYAQLGGAEAPAEVGGASARVAVEAALGLRWGTRQALAAPADLRWATKQAVQDSSALRWGTRQALSGAAGLRWGTRGALSDAADLRWATRQAFSDAADLRWATRQAVSDGADLRWSTRQALEGSLSLLWATRQVAESEAALLWATRQAAADAVSLLWGTQAAAGVVEATLALRWGTREAAQGSDSLLWGTRTSVQDGAPLLWGTRTSVGDAAALLWETRAAVSDATDLRWPTRQAIADAPSLRWGTRIAVVDSLGLRWATRIPAGDALALLWATRGIVEDSAALRWRTASLLLVAIDRDHVFVVPMEDRIARIGPENRAARAAPEDRTASADPEERIAAAPAEERILRA